MREHASALLVELVPEAVAARLRERAAVVVAVRARAGLAHKVASGGRRVRDDTRRTSVQSDLVIRVQIDALCRKSKMS